MSMEYERIDKVQTGIISPSKLRLKLLGPHNHKKKDGGSNSSRTSPSKLEDSEYVKNSLLATNIDDFGTEGSLCNANSRRANPAREGKTSCNQVEREVKETKGTNRLEGQIHVSSNGFQMQGGTNFSTVHPEENTDYDSGHDNASSSSFEFHKGERPLQNSILGPFSRPIPSKWYDAEKWVSTRQIMHPSVPKKNLLQSQVNRQLIPNSVRVAPETVYLDHRTSQIIVTDAKQLPHCNPRSQCGLERFSSIANNMPSPEPDKEAIGSFDGSILSINHPDTNNNTDTDNNPPVRSVEMRDTGTEMTPMTSLEPSRAGTPLGSTPIRSPTSSLPSTPRRGEPTTTPVVANTEDNLESQGEHKNGELSEKELQIRTRKEIVALGVQLGKMNIAAWASKAEEMNSIKPSHQMAVDPEQLKNIEFQSRAAAWEEAEKSKHAARFKREEIKIQAWESHKKSKLESEMKRLEVRLEQMKVLAQEKMVKKIALARQQSEEKLAIAETRKKRQAAKAAQQADRIRQTGRIPQSQFLCFNCFY